MQLNLNLKMKRLFLLASIALTSMPVKAYEKIYTGDGQIADFELEIKSNGKAVLALARKPLNEPFAGAKVHLQIENLSDDIPFSESTRRGFYEADIGHTDLAKAQILIETGDETDIIDITPEGETAATPAKTSHSDGAKASSTKPFSEKTIGLFAAFTGIGGLALGLFLGRLTRRRASFVSILAFSLTYAFSDRANVAMAHEGHAHAEIPGSDTAGAGGTVKLRKGSQFLIGVKTEVAKRAKVADGFITYGHVVARPQNDAQIQAPQAGTLRLSRNLILGQPIRKGQELATIEAVGSVRVTSPLNGHLLEMTAVDSSRIDAGAKLFRLTDTSVLWVDAEFYETDLIRLAQVTEAHITVEGISEPIKARILTNMGPINEKSRTAQVYVEFENPNGRIRLGTFATVYFALATDLEAMTLPISAVLNRGGEQLVFVQTGPDTFVARTVTTQKSSKPGAIIVTSGINDGERVVVSGNYQLLMKAK